jgi:serine phosphatase RsbU (regulator of sigma subunit)
MLKRLKSIAHTVSLQVEAHEHEALMQRYSQKDAIKENRADPLYFKLHKILRAAQRVNNLGTPIYTLVKDSASNSFYFGVTSAPEPYFRHRYKSFPSQLKQHYERGGAIPSYEDKHGVWLSAFAPVKTTSGKVVAVIQADMKFDKFIMQARQRLWSSIGISLLVFLIVTVITVYYVRNIWKNEERVKQQLRQSNQLIEEKNKSIMASMRYASRIQEAIFDRPDFLQKYFPNSFVFNKPKEFVSGDFFWCNSQQADANAKQKTVGHDKVFVAIVDCTGHGVPGALMSVIGFSLLNEIIIEGYLSPDEILYQLNLRVIETLKQDQEDSHTSDGMDIAFCAVNPKAGVVEFAGANRPLYVVQQEELRTIKGDKQPIGGMQYERRRTFDNNEISVNEGDCIYFCSDGYVDQFGTDGKCRVQKFKPKRLRQLLRQNAQYDMDRQYKTLKETFYDWKGDEEQIDDVSFIGIKF